MFILSFIGKYWQGFAAVLIVFVLYETADYHGYQRCVTQDKANLEEQEKKNEAILQEEIAKHIEKENSLQAIVDQSAKDRDKALADNLVLRKKGVALVNQNPIYASCIVPIGGVQYIQNHY